MNTYLDDIRAADRRSLIDYQVNRVHVWQRTGSKVYPALGYARRRPGPLLALWRALLGVFK